MADPLINFLVESFRIEGILRPPFPAEIAATEKFLKFETLTVDIVTALVLAYQPNARLRNKPGMDVMVGSYVAPRGGPKIEKALAALLKHASTPAADPWKTHVAYESLHPFSDGNGRSGRAIWLWQMHRRTGRIPDDGWFLRQFYYQTLSHVGRSQGDEDADR